MNQRLRKAAWTGWTRLASLASRSYMAGPELADALTASRRFGSRGFHSAICYWNDTGEDPAIIAEEYVEVLDAISGQPGDPYLSVKAPALGFDRSLVARVAERARAIGLRVHFDALGPETAEPTFELIDQLTSNEQRIGCTLPGRWRRSLTDADGAVERGLSVRVVKGEWPDPDAPDIDLRAGFLEVIDRLAGRASHVGVATHDVDLAREALTRLRAAGTQCEQELLFGLPLNPSLAVANELGVAVRIYVPYGHAWVPYCMSQIRKRPRIVWWIVKDLIASGFAAHRFGQAGST